MKKINLLLTALLFAGSTNLVFAGHDYGSLNGDRCHDMKPPCHHKAPPPCHGKKGKGNIMNMNAEDRQAFMQKRLDRKVKRMTKRLDLNTKQQKEVRAILQDSQKQMIQLREHTKEKIKKVLTKEQQERMHKRKQDR